MLEGLAEDGCGGVVHDQRHAERTADVGDFLDREDGELRIRQRLRVVGARLVVGRAAETLRVRRVDEAHLDAHRLHCVVEQVPRPAVKVGRADDIVAGLGDVLDREGRGRLARRQRERGRAALQRRHPLLQHVAGRVHDARIDVAEFFQREQVRGVLGIPELIGGRLIDRHRDGPGCRVGPVAGVQEQCFRILAVDRHGVCSPSRLCGALLTPENRDIKKPPAAKALRRVIMHRSL